MGDLLDLIHALMILAVPFMLGMVAAIEIVRRRPKSLEQQTGEAVMDRLARIATSRRFIGLGAEIANTTTIKMADGRTIEFIVREVV